MQAELEEHIPVILGAHYLQARKCDAADLGARATRQPRSSCSWRTQTPLLGLRWATSRPRCQKTTCTSTCAACETP
jgi:hypothetical protein